MADGLKPVFAMLLLLVAAPCSLSAQAASPTPAVIAELSNTLLTTDLLHTNERIDAAKRLGDFGPAARNAAPALLKALGDENAYVRGNSALALARVVPNEPGVAEAVAALLEDKALDVRQAAASALGVIGPPARAWVPQLVRFLDTENYYGVRETSARSLGQIAPEDPQVLPVLIRALKGTSRTAEFDRFDYNRRYYFNVQKEAAIALARSTPGIEVLLDTMAANGEGVLEVVEALAGVKASLGPSLPRVIEILKSPGEATREHASWLLSKVGDPAVPLVAPLLKDPRKDIRDRATNTLNRISTPLALKAAKGGDR